MADNQSNHGRKSVHFVEKWPKNKRRETFRIYFELFGEVFYIFIPTSFHGSVANASNKLLLVSLSSYLAYQPKSIRIQKNL